MMMEGMALALVGEAAVRAAFGDLFRAVREAKDTVSEFHPQLDMLSATLERIRPILDDIERLNRVLDRVGEMGRIQEMMTQGARLVKTSSKVGKYNFRRKYKYLKKLEELNKSIEVFITVDMQAVIMRDGKQILVELQGLCQEVKAKTNTLEAFYVNGSTSQSGDGYFVDYLVPQAPEVVIGGDAGRCFKEIKGKLLQDGFSPTVVSAPGGCGKTTLVTQLCHDEEIKGKFRGNILFIPISNTPNLVDIVQRMALRAGLVETIETKERAGDYLQQLLQKMGQKPLLIVLDDVWSSSESMLEKFVVSTLPDYKIIVTSRFEFPAFVESHRLKPLDHGESTELFHCMAIVEGGTFGNPINKSSSR